MNFLAFSCLFVANLNLEIAALAERVEHAKRGACSCGKLVKRDRSDAALTNLSDHRLLAFVLRLQHDLFLAAVFIKRRAAKIVQHKHSSRTKDLQSFFCESLVAFAQIRDGAIRTVPKSQGDENRIRIDDLVRLRTNRLRKNRHGRRSRQKLHQVDEVTNLADNPSSTFVRILRPVFLRNPTGIYSIQHRKRRLAAVEKLFRSLGQWREPSIESHHQSSR